MRASALRDRLRFDADAASTNDATAARALTPTEFCRRAANVVESAHVTGDYGKFRALKDRYPALQVAILLRYDTKTVQLTGRHRAVSLTDGRTFDLLGPPIDPENRKRELQLAATIRNLPRPAAL